MQQDSLKVGLKVGKSVTKGLWIAYQVILGALLLFMIYSFFWLTSTFHYFDIKSLQKENPETTAFIEREREKLNPTAESASNPHDKGPKEKKRKIKYTWIPMDSIPGFLREIVLIAEDGKFYLHGGFDIEQMEYAIVANHQQGRKSRGASTISQQVVKNLYLSAEKSYLRKIKEAVMTVLLEHYVDKDRILELYLNIAQWGPGVFGVREGALYHYEKPLGELKQYEMISLASVIPSPSKWDPKKPDHKYLRHRSRIVQNLQLYKHIRKQIPKEELKQWMEFAKRDEELRWNKLRDRELKRVPKDSGTAMDTSRVVNRDSIK